MTDDEDRFARIAVSLAAEPGNAALWAMVRADGAAAALERLLAADVADEALRSRAASTIAANGDPRTRAEIALRRAHACGARVVVPGDPEWPQRLDELAALGEACDADVLPPWCLWIRGPGPLGDTLARSVAVVGARAATPYGLHVTGDLAYGLTENDWTVVAGGAFGVEAAGHRGALAAGGRTVAVLACGVDRPYPVGNTALFDQIAGSGLLISEYPPGTDPLRHRFLARNRLVAAMTCGAVLVESALRSGSLHMMRRVLELGRAAMVVPGPVTSAVSAGGHHLLRTHPETILVTSTADVLETLEHHTKPAPASPGDGTPLNPA